MPATLRSQISIAFGTLVLVLAAALSFGLADQDARSALTDQGEKLHLLASAQHAERFQDEAAALHAADTALYEAKRNGRNRVVACAPEAEARAG